MSENKLTWRLWWQLFFTFFKISPLTFGGGYAMIPLLEKAVSERNKWIDKKEIVDVLAIAQTVPGSVAVNAATFIGYRMAGVPGALIATLGVITPTFVIVIILAGIFYGYRHISWLEAVFQGVRPAIVALIFYASYRMAKSAVVDKVTGTIAVAVLLVLLSTPVHPLLVLILGGATGVAFQARKRSLLQKKRVSG